MAILTSEEYVARMQGRKARELGRSLEAIIDRSLEVLGTAGYLAAEKTPEPVKVLSRPDAQGRFKACFAKKAQCDYAGTLPGGQSFRAEAKATMGERIETRVVRSEQREYLAEHQRYGAVCVVIAGFCSPTGRWDIFCVPYDRWIASASYTRQDLSEWEVPQDGVLRIDRAVAAVRSQGGL